MSESTPTVTITAGGYTASISLRGGQLLSLTTLDPVHGTQQNLIVPAEQGEGAYPGAVLAPWPNRIAQARYTHAGTSYELPVNEEATGAAVHGLLHDVDLAVQLQRESEVHLTGFIEPSSGYPFRLEVVLVYRVAGHLGLTATLSTRYIPETTAGDDADAALRATAPYGAGFHPYLTAADAPLKSCRLRLPASTVAKTKASGKVVGSKQVSGDLDLTSGPLLAGLTIDHAYTNLPEQGWSAELTHGPSGFVVRMIADTPWAQVYTGESINRAGVAVEPMTCPPNAFNSGKDLVELEPGVWHRVGYSLEAFHL
ncbi:aldose epimerase family protein [Nesterenkonia haasae]|uniref:aldose epimerase family protein n=1 Tax=Nesterenkonia haasae TaxID=2587813 RepID=UPI0013917586|nr:aldose epimerase [Nesterenkonia haasae]NDK31616.1 aldose epimerase [Nesterenkonia haasae]